MERWGAGVETQKYVRGDIGGWGRVPSNESCVMRLERESCVMIYKVVYAQTQLRLVTLQHNLIVLQQKRHTRIK